jgi:Asp-tRNA(Asn)/Glu-tRNA(Gln) amidotransferase A subunit family amidase
MVRRLRQIGASLPGKTTTCEFAFLHASATRNPWSPDRGPGGSSAGSAAAVAAGLLPAAIGSQTGGSTVRPASFCGVVGFKPSFDLLPTAGMKAFAPSLDTVGLFTAGVDDMRFFFAALCGIEARLERASPAGLAIGVVRTPWDNAAMPSARAALQTAATRLDRAGVRLHDIALPAAFTAAHDAHAVIQGHESVIALAGEHRWGRPALSECLASYLDQAARIDAAASRHARALAEVAQRARASLFAGVDALLTFAAADVAPADRASTGSPIFNRLWTLLGVPCISVPGLMAAGLPIGVQLVGKPRGEEQLLAVAELLARLLARGDAEVMVPVGT